VRAQNALERAWRRVERSRRGRPRVYRARRPQRL